MYYFHFSKCEKRPREDNNLLKVTEQASGKFEYNELWLQSFGSFSYIRNLINHFTL